MRSTGRESFKSSFSAMGSQRKQDDTIGDKQQREDNDADRATICKDQNDKNVCINASKLE